ncbi:hypothetical protein SAMN00790413_04830 [Deinococcus hopiensis KR-140]|uniref:Uncharacterized protein n=1 Tax=Deinococcus hopiensis KR-140 TaxID=695939 RepID=A0A1W1ULP8_9DEIO|nr:hypothetical protein SAMN00790413_04830 [Deinococcus hopiensis KR-140]
MDIPHNGRYVMGGVPSFEALNEAEVAVLSRQVLLDWMLRPLSPTGFLEHLDAWTVGVLANGHFTVIQGSRA